VAKKKKKNDSTEAPDGSPEEQSNTEAEVSADDENKTVTLSAEEQLQQELEASRDEAQKNHEQYLRTLADMENLRKRSQREKEELAKFGNETILREILPVVDNLERAVDHAVQDEGASGLLEGVQMTLNQFATVLEKFNVVPVAALGEPFDSAVHQAMGQMETSDYPPNTVAQEMQKGYLLNERLLRPSLVMVAKAPETSTGTEVPEDNTSDDDKS